MWNKKFAYVLNYLKVFKAVPKNNLRTHSPQQNKKAVLTIAAYFKVPLVLRDNNRASFTFLYQKGCFQYKIPQKWTPPLNSDYSN